MPIGADRCSRAAFWAVQVDLAEQDSISLYWREHLSSSGPPGRQRVSSLPPCHCKWLFLSFEELPCLLLLQPHPHALQPPAQVALLQLFIKRVIAIIANTFRSIWKRCSFWGYNDAAVITALVIGERLGGIFWEWSLWGKQRLHSKPPQASKLPQFGGGKHPGFGSWGPLALRLPGLWLWSSCPLSSLHFFIYKLCLSQCFPQRTRGCFWGFEIPLEAVLCEPLRFTLNTPGKVCNLLKTSVFMNM